MGKPLTFKTPEELQVAIEDYFQKCDSEGRPLSVTGLVEHIGLGSRKVLIDYENRPDYRHTVKRAKLIIEDYYEQQLLKSENPIGVIFNLKNNFGWQDKFSVQHKRNRTGSGKSTLAEAIEAGKRNIDENKSHLATSKK